MRKKRISATVTVDPQWDEVKSNLEAAGITHAGEVLAKVTNAELIDQGGVLGVKFCHSSLTILKTFTSGDGKTIPTRGKLDLFTNKKIKPGRFNFKALITSNEMIKIDVLSETIEQ